LSLHPLLGDSGAEPQSLQHRARGKRAIRGHKCGKWVKANATEVFVLYFARNPIGQVFPETMYELADTEARIPDLSVMLNEQLVEVEGEGLYGPAPVLAVEVVSSESAAALENKVELYLEKGCRTVLALYPDQRSVRLFDRTGASRLLRGDQLVEIDWLAGFAVPTERFFKGV